MNYCSIRVSSHLLAEHPFVFRAAVVFGLEKGKLGVLEVAPAVRVNNFETLASCI